MRSAAIATTEASLSRYRNTWRARVLSSSLVPVLYVLGFGVGASRTLPPSERAGHVVFIGAGLVVFFAVQISAVESGMPFFSDLNWHQNLKAVALTPATPATILLGHLGYLALRLVVVTLIIDLGVTSVGHPMSLSTLLQCCVAGIAAGAVMANLSVIAACRARNSFQIESVQRLLPMLVLATSGVLFPIGRLSAPVRGLIEVVNPFYHAVELCRRDSDGAQSLVHTMVLAAFLATTFGLARWALTRRLSRD